jgi:uncharacterized protein YbdZ (MbtH family)
MNSTIVGKLFEVSASEIESIKRWVETLARSVWHARTIHGDKFLKESDVRRFIDFKKRFDEFENKIGPYSYWNRMQEINKKWANKLLIESKQICMDFVKKGMVIIPMPGQTELVLLSRQIPNKITPKTAKEILNKAIAYGSKVRDENTTWFEWTRKILSYPMKPIWETSREEAMYPLYDAIEAAIKELLIWHDREPFWRWSEQPVYAQGSPEYEQWRKTINRIFIEAAALIGVHEKIAEAKAEAIDVFEENLDTVFDIGKYLVIAGGAALSLFLYSQIKKDKIDVDIGSREEPARERGEPSPHPA